MKKLMVPVLILLIVGLFTSTAQAVPVNIKSTRLVSPLMVQFEGQSSPVSLGAGEFDIHIKYSDRYTYSTVSYCIDPFEYIDSRNYVDYQIFPVSDHDASPPTTPPVPALAPKAAYLMDKYAVAFTDPSSDGLYTYQDSDGNDQDFTPKQVAAGLQLAIWDVLFEQITIPTEQRRAKYYDAYAIFIDDVGFLEEGFLVALNDGRQDQMFKATPTPEPATMLLMGTGLIGIGIASRRKFMK